jgi:hypothetical protein
VTRGSPASALARTLRHADTEQQLIDDLVLYSLRPKIFVRDFCTSLLIRLIRKNCENVIYFAMTFLSSYIF